MASKSLSRSELKRVAQLAHVSKVTVWRVMREEPNVAPATRERVLAVLSDLQIDQRLKLVGLILPDSDNPFWSKVGYCFEHELAAKNVQVVIARSQGDPDKEVQIADRLRSIRVSGVIYAPVDKSMKALAQIWLKGEVPVIVLDRRDEDGQLDSFSVNGRLGTELAFLHLLAHGHRRIGYLRGKATSMGTERFEAFLDMKAATPGITVSDHWIHDGDFTIESGRRFAEALLEMDSKTPSNLPTAILAANDLMAIGLMQRLQEAEWKLPERLSVIGFDNILWADFVHPRLTTIDHSIEQLARHAVNKLVERIQEHELKVPRGDWKPRRAVLVPPTLMQRRSVADLSKQEARSATV
jgi:LacI family transcriptional regulator